MKLKAIKPAASTGAVLFLCLVLGSAKAGAQSVPFDPDPVWSSGAARLTRSIALGDIDADGDLDLVQGNTNQSNALYRNDDGVFHAFPVWSSDPVNATSSLAVGDVDGDGDLDLVVGNDHQSNVLYLNEGGSLSTTPSWYSDPANATTSIALGDVDGDGDLDLVCGNRRQANELYLNDGSTFAAVPSWSSGPMSNTTGLCFGDVDADGDLDLVVANEEQENTLYWNEGGLFGVSPVWASLPTNRTSSIALADVDGDGDLDLVCGNRGQPNTVHLNTAGLFSTTPAWMSEDSEFTTSVALGDVDADGDLDLVCGNQGQGNVLYRNSGAALTPSPEWTSRPSYSTRTSALGDLDGDGDLDLVFGNSEGGMTLYRNGSGSLPLGPTWVSATSHYATSVTLADVDGDLDSDLIYADPGSTAGLYLNEGDSFSAVPVWLSDPSDSTICVTTGDLDGDGDLDLVCGNQGANTVYLGRTSGFSSVPEWVSDFAHETRAVALGDIDADGDLDLVCGNSSRNALYRNEDGILTSTPVWWSKPANETRGMVLGDVDGDGDLDLVCGNSGFADVLYLNEGGVLADLPAWFSRSGAFTSSVDLGDVDGDGDLDLVCGNLEGRNTLYENTNGLFSPDASWSVPGGVTGGIALEDMDGDGDLDLLCGSRVSGPTLYVNEGGSLRASPAWTGEVPSATQCITVGDLDCDGDVDLMCGNEHQGIMIYRSARYPAYRGDPSFPSHHQPNNGTQLRSVRLENEGKNRYHIWFEAVDMEADPLLVRAEYQFHGDPQWTPIDVVGPSPLGPFASWPQGLLQLVPWDVESFPFDPRSVVVRLRVTELPQVVSTIQWAATYVMEAGPIQPRRPLAFVEMTTVQFGTVTVGDTTSLRLSLQNQGNEPLVVSSIDSPSPEIGLTPNPPFEIQPNASVEITTMLAPRLHLDAAGDLMIRSNDPLTPTLPLAVEAEILPLSFSSELLGASERIPLGEATTVIVQAAANVHLERGVLFHRASGAPAFDSLPLTRSDAGFSATIHGRDVTERGLDYYVEMENSGIFATDPPGAPATFFTQAVHLPGRLETIAETNSGNEYLEGREITVRLALEEGTVVKQAQLFYRRGGDAQIDSTQALGSVPLFTATIPEYMVTSRGVEYWARVQTAATTLTYPLSGQTEPATIPITVRGLTEARDHGGMRYRMLSIPLDFGEEFAGTVADLIPELDPYDPYQARAFRYLPSANANVELTAAPGTEFRVRTARAFWLITRGAHRINTGSTAGVSTPTGAPFPIALAPAHDGQPGWTQFGNPFNFPVAWDGIQRSDAVGNPVAFDSSLGQAGGYSMEDVAILMPFEGYFIPNSSAEPETLWVSPVEAPASMVAAVTTVGTVKLGPIAKQETSPAWSLDLEARTAGAFDRGVRLGTHPDALAGHDSLDRPKPPSPPGPWVRLSVSHHDREDRPGEYRCDLREVDVEGHRWNLTIRSAMPAEEVVLDGWSNAALPEGLQLRLLDLEQGVVLNLRGDSGGYHVLSRGPGRDYRLTLLAGSADYVSREAEALTQIPRAVVLDQNAPNPFNPATRVRFGLPRPGQVSLMVYSIRGEMLAILLDREWFPAGFHTRIWDGRDRRGRPAASGVYFYRLTTEDGIISKKMVLMQ